MDSDKIKDWVALYMQLSREKALKLDTATESIGNLDDFSSPTQVVIASLTSNGQQFSVLMGLHSQLQPDGAIHVLGPMGPDELLRAAEAMLESENWREEVSTHKFLVLEGENEIRHVVASELAQFLDRFDKYIVWLAYNPESGEPHISYKWMMGPNGFAWQVIGDFTNLDPIKLVEDSISRRPRRLTRGRPRATAGSQLKRLVKGSLSGFGALCYPSVWVGNRSARSVADILARRTNDPLFPQKALAFEGQLDAMRFLAYQDGFFAIEAADRGEALESLNLVMALVWIHKAVPTTTVRDSELWSIQVDLDRQGQFQSSSTQLSSMRNLPAFPGTSPMRIEALVPVIANEVLEEVLTLASEVIRDPDLKFRVLMIHDGYTSLQEADYRQASIDCWLVIENWILTTWRTALRDGGRSNTAIRKMEGDRNWTAAVMSEAIELMGRITSSQLVAVTKWRKLRNDIVHDGLAPSKEQADGILRFGLSLIIAEDPPAPDGREVDMA